MRKKKKLLDEEEREKRIFEICDALDEISYEDRVKIWHHLNGWRWIDILPGKPDGWEDMTQDEQFVWADPICSHIEIDVGYKALLRYFHTTELGKTDEQFDDWWDSHCVESFKEHYKEFYYGYGRADNSSDRQKSIIPFLNGLAIGFSLTALVLSFIF